KFAPVAVASEPAELVLPLVPRKTQPGRSNLDMAVCVAVRSPLEATIRMVVCAVAVPAASSVSAPAPRSVRDFDDVFIRCFEMEFLNWMSGFLTAGVAAAAGESVLGFSI